MKQKIGFREELRTGVTHLWKENKFIIIVFLIGLSLLLAAVLSYARPLSDTGTIRVVNYAGPTLKLSDFKDKVLILDFWATYCAPCRALLPRYDSLQREMGAQLQILLVTHEPAGRAAAFLRQQGYILPSVTGDTLLAHAFPHNGIPFEVWINRGKIMAVTDGDEVSREQVENVLAGRSDRLARKVVTPFDEDKPLLVNGNGATEGGASVLYQSVMTPYNPGLNRIAGIHRAGGSINVFALNASPLSLYHLAFRGIDPMLDVSNRYLIEMPDSLDEEVGLGHTSGKAWLERFALCYNLVLPAAFKGDLPGRAQHGLPGAVPHSGDAVRRAPLPHRGVSFR
jgi:thiol-disulfide isomerase/thioredoxin